MDWTFLDFSSLEGAEDLASAVRQPSILEKVNPARVDDAAPKVEPNLAETGGKHGAI